MNETVTLAVSMFGLGIVSGLAIQTLIEIVLNIKTENKLMKKKLKALQERTKDDERTDT